MALRGRPPEKRPSRRAKILVYGASGVGKTWLSLEFPSVYYIDAEGGAREDKYVERLQSSGALYLGPEDGAGTFPVLLAELQALAKGGHDRQTVVIDSFSKIWASQVASDEEALSKRGKSLEYGAGNKTAARLSAQMVRHLDQLNMNVVLICHSKPRFGEDAPDTFDGYRKLDYELDLALEITRSGLNRKAAVIKSRIETFPVGSQFPWAYPELEQRFGKERLEGVVELATKGQLEWLSSLMVQLAIDPEREQKWKAHFKVDDLAKAPRAGMAKLIGHLESKVQEQQQPQQEEE